MILLYVPETNKFIDLAFFMIFFTIDIINET